MKFTMANLSTPIAQQRKILIDDVLPKCSNFDMFRKSVGGIYLDTESGISPSNGRTSNGIYLQKFS